MRFVGVAVSPRDSNSFVGQVRTETRKRYYPATAVERAFRSDTVAETAASCGSLFILGLTGNSTAKLSLFEALYIL